MNLTGQELDDFITSIKNLGAMCRTMEVEAYRLNRVKGIKRYKGTLWQVAAKLKECRMWIEDTLDYYKNKVDTPAK